VWQVSTGGLLRQMNCFQQDCALKAQKHAQLSLHFGTALLCESSLCSLESAAVFCINPKRGHTELTYSVLHRVLISEARGPPSNSP
jgi:hypothetical protein